MDEEVLRSRQSNHPENVTVVAVGDCTISYYPRSENFVAVCRHEHAVTACKVARPRREAKSNPAQGRPLGFLVAWLLGGANSDTPGLYKLGNKLSLERRKQARSALKQIEGSADLFTNERPRRVEAGEDSEPEDCP